LQALKALSFFVMLAINWIRTVDLFAVGANGSGKSNFFHAIRFALGDDTAPQRQALLHVSNEQYEPEAGLHFNYCS
jgi:predicted ATPase